MAKGNKKNDKKAIEKVVEAVVGNEVKEEIKETETVEETTAEENTETEEVTEVVSEFKADELPLDNLDDAFGEDEEITPADEDEETTEKVATDGLVETEDSVEELMKVVDENINKEKEEQQTITEKARRRTMREVYGYNWNGMCFDD